MRTIQPEGSHQFDETKEWHLILDYNQRACLYCENDTIKTLTDWNIDIFPDDSMLWKFIPTGNENEYYIYNKAARKYLSSNTNLTTNTLTLSTTPQGWIYTSRYGQLYFMFVDRYTYYLYLFFNNNTFSGYKRSNETTNSSYRRRYRYVEITGEGGLPNVKIGNKDISNIFLGNKVLNAMYYGENEIFNKRK